MSVHFLKIQSHNFSYKNRRVKELIISMLIRIVSLQLDHINNYLNNIGIIIPSGDNASKN